MKKGMGKFSRMLDRVAICSWTTGCASSSSCSRRSMKQPAGSSGDPDGGGGEGKGGPMAQPVLGRMGTCRSSPPAPGRARGRKASWSVPPRWRKPHRWGRGRPDAGWRRRSFRRPGSGRPPSGRGRQSPPDRENRAAAGRRNFRPAAAAGQCRGRRGRFRGTRARISGRLIIDSRRRPGGPPPGKQRYFPGPAAPRPARAAG